MVYTSDGRKFISEPHDTDPKEWTDEIEGALSQNALGWINVDGWILPLANVTGFKMVNEEDV